MLMVSFVQPTVNMFRVLNIVVQPKLYVNVNDIVNRKVEVLPCFQTVDERCSLMKGTVQVKLGELGLVKYSE